MEQSLREHSLSILKNHKHDINYRYDVAAYIIRASPQKAYRYDPIDYYAKLGKLDPIKLKRITLEYERLESHHAEWLRKQDKLHKQYESTRSTTSDSMRGALSNDGASYLH